MKALSIKNPWAWLIAKGVKDIENRSRRTHYRGKILIHVSQRWDAGFADMSNMFSYEQWNSLNTKHQNRLINQSKMPTGVIIGEVNIVDCIQDSKSIWALENHFHWVLENPVFYNSCIPNVKGSLGLWNYNGSINQTLKKNTI